MTSDITFYFGPNMYPEAADGCFQPCDLDPESLFHYQVETYLDLDSDMLRITDSVGRMVPIDLDDIDGLIAILSEIRVRRQMRDFALGLLDTALDPQTIIPGA